MNRPYATAGTSSGVPPVMFLGDHFGYSSGVVHGVTIYFLNVLPALAAAGLDITACFLREPHPAAAELQGCGIEPVFLSAHPLDPLVVFRVVRLARQRGCGIIHAAGIKATLVGRIVARMVGAEVVIHVHDHIYPPPAMSKLHRLLSRPTDTGLSVSKSVIEVVVNGYHVPSERCHVIYNGIRLDLLRNPMPAARSSRRAEFHIRDDANVVTMIGRMHPIKGHRGMLEIMARIVEACPDTVLLLVGDGPERSACEALAVELGLQANVRFVGQRGDIPELLAASDLVVVPSHSEGLGLTAVEALAAGKPVVAYGIEGLREVVSHDSDGILVDSGDREGFARAVVKLLRDPALRERYGRTGAVSAHRFSLERHVAALLGCYREIAGAAVVAGEQ